MKKERLELPLSKKIFRSFFCVFLFFTAILYLILSFVLTPKLLQSEIVYMEEKLEAANNVYNNFMYNTTLMTQNQGLDEQSIALFNADSMSQMAIDRTVTSYNLINYIVIKNGAGENIFCDFYDYEIEQELDEPTDFTAYISELTTNYRATNGLDENGQYSSSTGIVQIGNDTYGFSIMPVISNNIFIGTITYGAIFSDYFFKNLMYVDNVNFELLPYDNHILGGEVLADNGNAVGLLPLSDSYGNYVTLSIEFSEQTTGSGSIYTELLLYVLGIFLAFSITLYGLFRKMAVSPIEKLDDLINKNKEITDNNYEDLAIDKNNFAELASTIEYLNSTIEKLKEADKNHQIAAKILDNLDILIYANDVENKEFLYVNKTFADTLNINRDAAIGTVCHESFFGDNAPLYNEHALPLTSTETADLDVSINTIHKSSNFTYYQSTNKLIKWIDDSIVHLQISTDFTEILYSEKEIEKRLKEQELMTSILQNFISNEAADVLLENALKMLVEFLDVNRATILSLEDDGETLKECYKWEDSQNDDIHYGPLKQGNNLHEAFILNDKPYVIAINAEESASFGYNGSGDITIFVAPILVNDKLYGVLALEMWVRPYKHKESHLSLVQLVSKVLAEFLTRDAIREKLELMSGIVNNSPQIIAYVRDSTIIFANKATSTITGYSQDELQDMSLYDLLDEETGMYLLNEIKPRAYTGEVIAMESYIITKDGKKRDMMVCIFASISRGFGLGVVAVDITEKNILEQELIMAKEQAELSSQAKTTFLSNMSHEMRTPMNAIIGMTNIAMLANEIDRKDYCLNKIDLASKHLLGVINDILDMSKIEANKFELSYTDFTLEKMLMKVTNVINFRVDEKNQDLIIRVSPDVPIALVSDEQHLNQVITNLLSNAVKFTPENGKITLDIEKISEVNGVFTLKFSVTDTGIGVTPEQKARLFKSFEQADGSISRKFGGTGLGLSISKTIVELMGGEIWVESEYGHGSSFIFTMQAEEGKIVDIVALNPDINWNNLRILVVDDSIEVREYFQTFAQAIEVDLMVAEDGYQALDIINSTDGIFIVFLDWRMPKMNGIELAEKIKEKYGDSIIIIMISGVEWESIESEAKEAGVKKFIQKPLFASTITDCLNQCLGSRSSKEEPMNISDDAEISFKGHTILLAEDVEVNREIVMSLLEDTEIEIDCAENGIEAVEKFQANPDKYDMIFMDIHMPEMGGFEATKKIRLLDTNRKDIPIVAMTANVFREDIEECLAAGMDDHVGKPIDISDVIDRMKKYINL